MSRFEMSDFLGHPPWARGGDHQAVWHYVDARREPGTFGEGIGWHSRPLALGVGDVLGGIPSWPELSWPLISWFRDPFPALLDMEVIHSNHLQSSPITSHQWTMDAGHPSTLRRRSPSSRSSSEVHESIPRDSSRHYEWIRNRRKVIWSLRIRREYQGPSTATYDDCFFLNIYATVEHVFPCLCRDIHFGRVANWSQTWNRRIGTEKILRWSQSEQRVSSTSGVDLIENGHWSMGTRCTSPQLKFWWTNIWLTRVFSKKPCWMSCFSVRSRMTLEGAQNIVSTGFC